MPGRAFFDTSSVAVEDQRGQDGRAEQHAEADDDDDPEEREESPDQRVQDPGFLRVPRRAKLLEKL